MTPTPRAEDDRSDPINYWNAWTSNYSARSDGYITHAFFLGAPDRTLCGVKWQESGWLNLGKNPNQWWEPGCVKCWNAVNKLGLLAKIGGSKIHPERTIWPKTTR